MSEWESPGRSLKTIETATTILDTVQRLEGAELSEIAVAVDLAESTVHGYLTTLESLGYLTRNDQCYHIGLEFLNKGGHARARTSAYELIIPKVDSLASQTGERIQFIVEENGYGYYIHVATGENAILVDAHIGKRVHLHASSAGKAILSALPKARVDAILDRRGMPSYTPATITTRSDLTDELAAIDKRGYSISNEESISGLTGMGVSIHSDTHGEPIGAISLSVSPHRFDDEHFEDEISNALLRTVNEIELDLQYR